MTNEVPLVVIVGGGFGGLAAAKSLRRAPVNVLLIDRSSVFFQWVWTYLSAKRGDRLIIEQRKNS